MESLFEVKDTLLFEGRDTKADSYYDLSAAYLNKNQLLVLNALKGRNMTYKELSLFLGKPINEITPRVNELRKLNYVIATEKTKDRLTGKSVWVWGVM